MKSYCFWPVRLKGYEGEAHITCNWFGDKYVHPIEIASKIAELDTSFSFHGNVQCAQFNSRTQVLEILDPAANVVAIHNTLASIRPNDYPTYRPHITVPYDYWVKCLISDQPLDALIEEIGPLTLKVDGAVVATFRERVDARHCK